MADTTTDNNYASDLTRQRQAAKMGRSYSSDEIAQHANLYETDQAIAPSPVAEDQAEQEAGRVSRLTRLRNQARGKRGTKSVAVKKGTDSKSAGALAFDAKQAAKNVKLGNFKEAAKDKLYQEANQVAALARKGLWSGLVAPDPTLMTQIISLGALNLIWVMAFFNKRLKLKWYEQYGVPLVDVFVAMIIVLILTLIFFVVELMVNGAESLFGG